jgi:rfaE bifunctional protein kinase chain/domain/rfaE bifunctional protein nucleotidyltransferase chain/domain
MIETSSATPGKVYELEALAAVLASEKKAGKRIVLCHGVFDLLHVGHVRHFEEAREQGDVLVVTLTADAYVNKGPHRPAFTETLRAEVLAALAPIDYVAVSHHPTAERAIAALRPDVYVKGPDYRTAADDVTGGITREEEAVRAAGGRIYYTQAELFSSSHILNRYLPSFPPDVEAYLADFRSRHLAGEVIEHLERLRSLNLVVVGEAIVDEYVNVDQMGKSSKDPVLAMRYASTQRYAGGALAVANHAAAFCGSVELVTYLGKDDPQESFIREHLHPNVRTNFIYKSGAPTIVKRRYVEQTLLAKLFEVYVFNDDPVEGGEERQLCELLQARMEKADCVIASDFGHGLITKGAIALLADSGKFLAVNTQVNAANIRFHAISNYRRADYVCINEGELRLDARSRREPLPQLIADLERKLVCDRVLVTRGKQGVAYFDQDREHMSPSLAMRVVDRIGSGDAVLAVTSLCAKAGVPGDVTAFIANVIGAQQVQVIGNSASVDRVATIKFVQALLK